MMVCKMKQDLSDITIEEPGEEVYVKARENFDSLAKPLDGFGVFEDIICRVAAIQGTDRPDISKKGLIIMCADNGVVAEGVSQAGSDVTLNVAKLMAENKSTVGVMAAGLPVEIIPVDIGIASDEKIDGLIDKKIAAGTKNIAKEPAMTFEECLSAIYAGIDTVKLCRDRKINILATGEMGIGNTTTSTALFCALSGSRVRDIAGRGAGLSDEGLIRKTEVIENALKLHGFKHGPAGIPSFDYALRALSVLGGFDIAGLAGVFIGAAKYRIPVIIDGFISAVAALTAVYLKPVAARYMIASHTGREKGTEKVLDKIGIKSVINADMALGEGTGAVMMFPLMDMVMSVYKNGTGFIDTKISRYERFV